MSGVERSSAPLEDDPFASPLIPGVIPDVLDAEADLPVAVDEDDPFANPAHVSPSQEFAGGDVGGPSPDEPDLPVAVDEDGDSIPLDIEKIRLYQRLRDAEDAATTEGKALKEEADKLMVELIAMFSENGLQNLNVDGRTAYLQRTVYAQRKKGVTAEDVIAALIADGEADLVKPTVNANTLSAWVRELTEDDDAPGLPEHAAQVLEPGERYRIGLIAGGTKSKSKTHSK